MAAFRLYSKMRSFLGMQGQLLAGGYLTFEAAGTSTPKDVYGSIDLTPNNGSTVALDASGRPDKDIWGQGDYFVELFNSDGVKQGEADWVQIAGGAGAVLPALALNEFITSDGSQMVATTIRQLPDPTGHVNKILGTDGETWFPVARPADGAAGESDVTATATGFSVLTMSAQTGTGTAPNVGGKSTSVDVVFATPFASTPIFIGITPTPVSTTSTGAIPPYSVTAKSTTGFTVKFVLGEQDDTQSQFNFNAAVPFDYLAFGVKV